MEWEKDPYLYTAKMIMEGSGDEVSTRFGIREFYVDSETGFFLNQESYPCAEFPDIRTGKERMGNQRGRSKRRCDVDS